MKVRGPKKLNTEHLLLFLVIVLLIGIPYGINAYDRSLGPQELPPGAKSFTLVGNAQKGWLLDDVQAHKILSLWNKSNPHKDPVIEVNLGDMVVLKLRSSDVTHGFSLKAYGIYMANGIQPGKTAYVTFRADKAGTFLFSCNVFCGDIHQHMQGKLVVR